MADDNSFLKHWFSGVNRFLTTAPPEATDRFLSECARSCGDSYSLGVYREAFKDNPQLEEGLRRLSERFDDFAYIRHSDRIDIIYSRCGCDLVNDGFVTSPSLCRCSEKSLLTNWEALLGAGNITVTCRETILNGNSRCRFEIRLLMSTGR